MATDRPSDHRLILSPYLPAILLLAGAVLLALFSGLWPAAGAVGLAGLSWFTTRRLYQRLSRAEQHQRMLDLQLLHSQKLAAIGELSAGIAHEINNPLAIIYQEADWTRRLLKKSALADSPELEEISESLGQINQQVNRCKEIIQNLLNFARKREPVIQAVEINRLIEDMAVLVEKTSKYRNIAMVRQYQPDIPLIMSDPPQLRQIILNLLNNATHAIDHDGTITITTCPAGPEDLEIAISDTGCGIPPENLEKIFDPFFTTKPEGKGTGLGLAICHRLVVNLGGQISVASQVNQGTTFTMKLPLTYAKGAR